MGHVGVFESGHGPGDLGPDPGCQMFPASLKLKWGQDGTVLRSRSVWSQPSLCLLAAHEPRYWGHGLVVTVANGQPEAETGWGWPHTPLALIITGSLKTKGKEMAPHHQSSSQTEHMRGEEEVASVVLVNGARSTLRLYRWRELKVKKNNTATHWHILPYSPE
ncbi:hypothetical protein BJV78DRAFT_1184601 [Lactifluus subvellereus]|nr:hypothetical protein BJV78DRAFT_1184601 [Lactifluus subvellereus]